MPRTVHRLSAVRVSKAKAKGLLADGGGLYLQIGDGGARSWIFRFKRGSKENWMGLGSAGEVTLAEAREAAGSCRRALREGIDPLGRRKALRVQNEAEAAKAVTFKHCTERYIEAHRAGWRNAKHAEQWKNTLATYAEPLMGALSVAKVDTGLVLQALEPIWTVKTETASRVRSRIEAVLDWAAAKGYRQGENPARWRGHMSELLPKKSKVQKVAHHPAIAFDDLPAFMSDLRSEEGVAAKALEFLILTAGRTGEVVHTEWPEVDTRAKVWGVPSERMKSDRAHRVPLSAPALAVLEAMKPLGSRFVFPGIKPKRPLSDDAMLALLGRMGREDLTVHGFRSTFRDWAAERTNYPRDVAEMALAHVVSDKTEAAYRRGDLFEKRRRLMDEWARYCASGKRAGDVVPMRRGKA